MAGTTNSLLEKKAVEVAQIMQPAASDPKKFGLDILMIIKLVMTVISTVIENCPMSKQDIAKAVAKPTRRQQAALLKECKSACECCGPQYQLRRSAGQMADAIEQVVVAMEDDDVEALVDEVRSTNMFL